MPLISRYMGRYIRYIWAYRASFFDGLVENFISTSTKGLSVDFYVGNACRMFEVYIYIDSYRDMCVRWDPVFICTLDKGWSRGETNSVINRNCNGIYCSGIQRWSLAKRNISIRTKNCNRLSLYRYELSPRKNFASDAKFYFLQKRKYGQRRKNVIRKFQRGDLLPCWKEGNSASGTAALSFRHVWVAPCDLRDERAECPTFLSCLSVVLLQPF